MAFEVTKEQELFSISKLKKVSALETKDGKQYINIREYFFNDEGELLPTKKGIMIQPDTFLKMLDQAPELKDKIQTFFSE